MPTIGSPPSGLPPSTTTSTTPSTTASTPASTPETVPAAPISPPPAPPAPAGLDAATTAGRLPTGGAIANVVAGGISAMTARLAQPGSHVSALELIPGRVPDAVSLPTVLRQLADSGPVIDGLAAEMKKLLGVDVPPALVAAVKAKPERVVELLALSPGQMRAGFDAMHGAHRARHAQGAQTAAPGAAPEGKARFLPKTFDLADLDRVVVKRPAGDLKELAPGLFRGDVPNASLGDDAARRNIVLAEILDRLAQNPGAPSGDVFTVKHNGHAFTRIDGFLESLTRDGCSVDAVITHRIADFAGLKTKAPDGSILDVPAGVLVKTGVVDDNGKEAVLPSVHSEIVFRIRSGPSTQGPKLDGDVKFYQGVPNTGFFAANLMRKSTWTGSVEAAHLDQAQALRAASLAAVLGDVIQDVGAQKNLAMAGYGVTGVCNDSVAIVQHAVTGTVTAYPLFMRDDELLPEIDKRLADKNRRDDPALRALKASIEKVPSDDVANPTAKQRALSSIPWPAGAEPFASVEEARAILSS